MSRSETGLSTVPPPTGDWDDPALFRGKAGPPGGEGDRGSVTPRALRTEKETFSAGPSSGPALFFSNDERAKGATPEPPGPKDCSRVDWEDIAAVAATVFRSPESYHGPGKSPSAPRKRYASDGVASIRSEAMGRQIKVGDHSDQVMDMVEEFGQVRAGVGSGLWERLEDSK